MIIYPTIYPNKCIYKKLTKTIMNNKYNYKNNYFSITSTQKDP